MVATTDNLNMITCSVCLDQWPKNLFYPLIHCKHLSCRNCLVQYLTIQITESRINITCPQCENAMHPSDIQSILSDRRQIYEKYENFMVRRVLASVPDTRWCPAPDCGYAVIASGCASCPLLKCQRPTCGTSFCYHCKAEWHPNQTCDAARITRTPSIIESFLARGKPRKEESKPCPRCKVTIMKLNDGSCNHMSCAVCGAEFCWLCMKEISDIHYLSPSGCTFWGKKTWSRKKKLIWQIITLIGAPVGIALIAGISIPGIIIGVPVWVGKTLYNRFRESKKRKRRSIVTASVLASIIISPVLAGLAVALGIPALLFFVYGIMPVSLCRQGECGLTGLITSATGLNIEFDEENIVPNNEERPATVASPFEEKYVNFNSITHSDQITPQSARSHNLEVQADVNMFAPTVITFINEKSVSSKK